MGSARQSLKGGLVLTLALGLTVGCKGKQVDQGSHTEAQQLFDSVCAKCHGRDGRGGVPSAEGQPPPRNFRDAAFQTEHSDAQLAQVIKQGKGPMPPFGALFDDAQTALLVSYIRSFNPKK